MTKPKTRYPIPICPKCGSMDSEFTETGHRKCNACQFVGRVPLFRRGGPKPAHKLDIPDRGKLYIGGGSTMRLPTRYDE